MGEEGRRHPVAWLDPANHRTDRDDISRAIGTGSDWAIYRCRIYPLGDHQIAIVERHSTHPDAYFVRRERALDDVFQLQPVDLSAMPDPQLA